MQRSFYRSIVGGTFDRFHKGHQKLLFTAFEQSEYIVIGIATNELFKDKQLAHFIEDYKVRRDSIDDFLFENNFLDRSEIVPITDMYGISLQDEHIDAIFVTESNKANVGKINEARREKGFHPLAVITVPYVMGNDGEIISSERIRRGLIDREGNAYTKLFDGKQQFILPEHSREALREPIGPIIQDMKEVIASITPQSVVIAVGDIVSESIAQHGRQADISIIDGKTRRLILEEDFFSSLVETKRTEATNLAGTITHEAIEAIQTAITDYAVTGTKQLLIISGEEDLLAIPSILLSPLQTVVLYGQFDQGIVVVQVTEQNKKHVYDLFRKFQ